MEYFDQTWRQTLSAWESLLRKTLIPPKVPVTNLNVSTAVYALNNVISGREGKFLPSAFGYVQLSRFLGALEGRVKADRKVGLIPSISGRVNSSLAIDIFLRAQGAGSAALSTRSKISECKRIGGRWEELVGPSVFLLAIYSDVAETFVKDHSKTDNSTFKVLASAALDCVPARLLRVIGVDLSPNQPSWLPPNVEFQIDDIDEEWTYSAPFDYVHSRMMNSSVKDWRVYLEKCLQSLAPGGYVEVQEIDLNAKSDDGTLREDSNLSRWLKLLGEATVLLGRPYQDIQQIQDIMAEVGFRDVTVTNFKWPTNPWPKDTKYKTLGQWHNANMSSAIEALTLAPFTRALGWSPAEVQAFLVDTRKDLNNRGIHAYWPIVSVAWTKGSTVEVHKHNAAALVVPELVSVTLVAVVDAL
ncbi:hypothetical protein CEP53_003880 [Fusarium sp. AF-6]|nr:hypothetical protein CEP53_003880 [Fusarium sp. AF-6]